MKTSELVRNALGIMLGLAIASTSYGAARFDPEKQPYGQLPPLTITGFNLSGGTQKAFQVWFDGFNWAGDVVAYPLGSDGKTDVSTRLWSTNDVFLTKQACGNGSTTDAGTATVDWFSSPTGRKVVTRTTFGSNKSFRWLTIPGHQSSIGDATTGPKIVDYIRGDRINEKENVVKDGTGTVIQYECGISTGTMRARTSIMGDILHGKSVYVAAPPADFQFDEYQAFKTAKAARAPRVYVGANDGMLHALSAATGEEIWAYIPSMLIPKLKKLAADPYTHTYFIDGGLVAGDVNAGSSGTPNWKTVLVGSLGAGGKGLFGLDVTSPDASSETWAAMKILWEITPASTGFSDLGDTYGDPMIVRLNTGEWGAIVGNGYNNAGSGNAVLYVINVVTGALIAALDTGSGSTVSPNGLSSPVAIDTNFDSMVDYVYAGDIDGNMWKFNIKDSTASNWSPPGSALYSTGKAIIGAPDVAAHPVNGYMVYFATGRLFNDTDAADSTVVNHAYGIWDAAPAANDTILDQTLTEKNYGILRVRVTSGLPINWTDASDVSTKPLNNGWRIALPAGERVLGTGFVRDARYHFSSVNPTITHTSPPNGENWLNEFDYLTGGVGNKLIFDLSSDSLLTDADRITDGSGVPIVGPTGIPAAVYQGGGLISQPLLAILSAQLSTTIFNNNPFFNPNDKPAEPPAPNIDPGVSGGHFDSDIYSAEKKMDHTHEYDDKFDVTGINFLAPSDPVFNIANIVPNTGTKFKILIANQKMSPAVNFSYGGLPYENVTKIVAYTTAGLTMSSLPTFTRTDVTTLKYNMPKDAFKVKDWAGTGDTRVGLMPTQTGCVNNNGNMGTLGRAPNLLHHNGALTFQVIKDTTPDSAVVLADAAGDPAYGYRVTSADREDFVLGEWTVFWHHPNGECLHEAGWVEDPPEDLTPADPDKAKTPAPGSIDPPRDTFGSVVGTTITIAADPVGNGKTIRTTTTIYSTGIIVIIKEYIDNRGKVKKVTITTIQPAGGGGGGALPGNGISQALSAGNTVTGYQQTRNSGKLGRVTWHELLAP
jgi:type IV pilus assembly protein PilY1